MFCCLFVLLFFFSYLIRPIVDIFTTPFGVCADKARTCDCFLKPEETLKLKKEEEKSLLGNTESNESNESSIHEDIRETWSACISNARCPHSVAVIVSLLIVMASLGGAGMYVVTAIERFQSDSLSLYESQAEHLRNEFLNWLQTRFHVNGSRFAHMISNLIPLSNLLQETFLLLYHTATGFFVVLLFILYLLFEKRRVSYGRDTIPGQIDKQIQKYITLKSLISGFVGFIVYLTLGPILRINMAGLFGVITFLLNFIPTIGPVIAVIIPAPVIIFDPHISSERMAAAFILPLVAHGVIGNFVEPCLFGDSLQLHPIFLLLSLAFWYAAWGIQGAILAVPMTAIMKIIAQHSNHPYAVVILCLVEGKIYSLLAKRKPRWKRQHSKAVKHRN